MKSDFVSDSAEYQEIINRFKAWEGSIDAQERRNVAKSLFSCIDNTTLNGSDSPRSVAEFCRKTVENTVPCESGPLRVASVCVYPSFVDVAKRILDGSGIWVASVAGGFPAGQTSQRIKVDEVRYVVGKGADEVDFVINRGNFLDGNEQAVFDEVAAAKEACGERVRLKVIIESGELQTPENIYNASHLVLQAGADFIKTSTGKIPVGATPEAAYAMLKALTKFTNISKKDVGFKAAGGISSIADAMLYHFMYKEIVGEEYITNQKFRIGTSRLTGQLVEFLTLQ